MTDGPSDGVELSHIGISVSDMNRSTNFYVGALGFKQGSTRGGGAEYSDLTGLAESEFVNRFLSRDGVTIELVQFLRPVPGPPPAIPKLFNEFGLTHLSFRVSNVDEVTKRIEEFGGSVLEHAVYEGNLEAPTEAAKEGEKYPLGRGAEQDYFLP
jgi:catechol 2,3-dioxygenase-like lactoylglutathione lyase family enzyme